MNQPGGLVREGNALYLQGKVGFETVNGLYLAFRNELSQGINTIDCTRVIQCDSSAISLLLAGLSLARNQQVRLQIRGMNDQMRSLARLYDVESLLVSDSF